MNGRDLEELTMTLAVRVLKMTNALPNTVAGHTVANQVARCGTSVASNYRLTKTFNATLTTTRSRKSQFVDGRPNLTPSGISPTS